MATNERSLRFIGLVSKASRSRSENEIQNPKAFVFVALNALVVAEYGDVRGERVPIHVNESGAEKGDCSVNVDVWDVDVDGEGGCDAIGDCGEEVFFHGFRLGERERSVKEKNKIILRESEKVRIHWGKRGKNF